ncbi:MAG: hypothetical protein LBT30_06540 [Clostridiales bacterium]|jgi:hypothetical protein|nr:hypothetical protein [Clostridiales bacterium]
MEETELLDRAKYYIDSLARGIDPISGKEMPDDELLNNVKMSRCFFYVSDVLGRVIERGGVTQKVKRAGLCEFALSDEQKARIKLSETPLPITNFVKEINEVINQEEYKKLSYNTVLDYLISEGYLVVRQEFGGDIKCPTEKGVALGIIREKREYQNKTSYVNVYNVNAQRFIVDNLNQM